MRVLVCGGRDFNDKQLLYQAIADVIKWESTDDMATWLPPSDTVIIHGGARGADLMARDWAVVHWVPDEEYPADWDKHGKAAGFIRNQQMLDEAKPDVVLAMPGGKGTKDMVERAKKAGVPVVEY